MKETRVPFVFFQGLVHQPDGLEKRHVDVRGAVPAGESSNKVTGYSPVEKISLKKIVRVPVKFTWRLTR